jgi:hypothetical protein
MKMKKVWALDSKYYGVCLHACSHAYCIGSQEITSISALKTYANKEMIREIGAPARRKWEVREVIYYRLEKEMEDWPEAERDQVICTWIYELERTTYPVRMQAASEMMSMLSIEQQEAIRESQAQYSQRAPDTLQLPRMEPLVELTDDEADVSGSEVND